MHDHLAAEAWLQEGKTQVQQQKPDQNQRKIIKLLSF